MDGCSFVGSSPRVRGTAPANRRHHARLRFIPARAGNGSSSSTDREDPPVHPRACGERSICGDDCSLPSGSSPRVRGTVLAADKMSNGKRFIPARAGNGYHAARRDIGQSVHPRACGERSRARSINSGSIGSSPRVRGTVVVSTSAWWLCRFIPARAGNGRPRSTCSGLATVHPRACGERGSPRCRRCSIPGSSPRVRGTASRLRASPRRHRFIPARAGERPTCRRDCCPLTGSSPRVRGTARRPRPRQRLRRFIPARAGNGT